MTKYSIILKDPGASFSLQSLVEVAGGVQIACVRDPLMTCASGVRLGFSYGLSGWQGAAWERVLSRRVRELLARYPAPRAAPINCAIGWCAIYDHLLRLLGKKGYWFFHDDFCKGPHSATKKLFEAVGLVFDEDVARKVKNMTGEQPGGEPVKVAQLDTKRDVRKMERYWDQVMTPAMAREVEEICEPT